MAKNYSISFMSLRSHTVYTVNVGGGTGTAVALKGGAQPFSTQESDDEDPFTPIRTQTGYLRIVDDGYAADGTTAFDWRDLIPTTDTSRPVTLTHQEGGSTIVDWQGFLQAQTFSGALYGNPQEREYPVQCVLSALGGIDVTTTETQIRNFAYLINYIFTQLSVTIGSYVVQGGADARTWLGCMIDWRNFLTDNNGVTEGRYKLLDILEDVCKFWGWTARTYHQQVIFTCIDDTNERNLLTLTPADMVSLAGGSTTAGTISTMPASVAIPSAFASTQNQEVSVRGKSKAKVKVSVPKESEVMKFAPQSVEDYMEQTGYTWVDGTGDAIGYYTTQPRYSFTSQYLTGEATANSGFVRRHIFSEIEEVNGTPYDMILVKRYFNSGTPIAQLQTVYETAFSGGTISLNGTIFYGADQLQTTENARNFVIRLGIGHTRATAKWFQLVFTSSGSIWGGDVSCVWRDTPQDLKLMVRTQPQLTPCVVPTAGQKTTAWITDGKIPVDDGLYGFVFVDIMGSPDIEWQRLHQNFEIGNFSVEYSRNKLVAAGNGNYRYVGRDRNTSKEYTAKNQNQSRDEWNADCIFASDNEMEYGFGLMLLPNGQYMAQAPYNGNTEIPEQHLANRVSAFWNTDHGMMTIEMQSDQFTIDPIRLATMSNKSYFAQAISREWRDDVTLLSLIEM